jgi:hypothetical protein
MQLNCLLNFNVLTLKTPLLPSFDVDLIGPFLSLNFSGTLNISNPYFSSKKHPPPEKTVGGSNHQKNQTMN